MGQKIGFSLTILLQKQATIDASAHQHRGGDVGGGGKKGKRGRGRATYHFATTTGMYPQTYSLPLWSAVDICTLAHFRLSFNGRPNSVPGGTP